MYAVGTGIVIRHFLSIIRGGVFLTFPRPFCWNISWRLFYLSA